MAEHALRVCSLNIAHGRGRRFHQGLLHRRAIEQHLLEVSLVLRREQPDVVALQEADGPCLWSGGFDHVRFIAERSGYAHHLHGHHMRIGKVVPRLRYGCALLARRPLHQPCDQPFSRAMPSPNKGFVAAAVALPGPVAIDVVSCHLDPARPALRRRQVLELAEAIRERERPLILMGDFNTRDFGKRGALGLLSDELALRLHRPGATDLATFPSRRPRRRLDWILCSPALHVQRYRVLPDRISDHCAVVADLHW